MALVLSFLSLRLTGNGCCITVHSFLRFLGLVGLARRFLLAVFTAGGSGLSARGLADRWLVEEICTGKSAADFEGEDGGGETGSSSKS